MILIRATLLVLLLASEANATICFPNGIDITARLDAGDAFKFFPMSGFAQTSTMDTKDCLDLTSLDYVTALTVHAGHLAPNAKKKAIGAMNLCFTRICVQAPYRGALQSPAGGIWAVGPQGRLYQEAQHTLDAYGYELTSSSKRVQASKLFESSPDLRNALDVDPTFHPSLSASFVLPGEPGGPPEPVYVSSRASAFPIDTRKKVPACGNGDCSGLTRVHDAHACVAAAKIAGQPTSGCPSPALEHSFYVFGCRGNELCEAFRRVAPFRPDEDRQNLTKDELIITYKIQDVDHMGWMGAQALGDWKKSDLFNIRHLLDHSIMNVADPRRLVVYPCDIVPATQANPAMGKIASFQDFEKCFGGPQSIKSILPKLKAAYL